jgi:hypothetical protein
MGNLKQRLIKPGRDFNYAEGVKVRASAAIYADQIVYVSGSEGVYLKAAPADADDAAKTIGRLMIAKHDIPANGYGVRAAPGSWSHHSTPAHQAWATGVYPGRYHLCGSGEATSRSQPLRVMRRPSLWDV